MARLANTSFFSSRRKKNKENIVSDFSDTQTKKTHFFIQY